MDIPLEIEAAFGLALREARGQVKISQERLALAAGLDRTHISLLERGKRQPTLRTLFLLTRELKIPASILVERVEALMSDTGHTG